MMQTPRRGIASIKVVSAIALVLIGVTLPLTSAQAEAGARTQVVDCGHYRVEPALLVLTCGDGNTYLAKMHWAGWHANRARGHGRLWINNCKPNCAGGTFHHYPVRVRLDKAVSAKMHRVFSEARLTFPKKAPPHSHRYARMPLPTTPG